MMVIWRIFLPSSMLTSVRPYRQVLLGPLYTQLTLSITSQSSKEEIESGGVVDFTLAREAKNDLRCAVNDSLADVKSWGGEFPFERAAASIEYWKF